MPAPASTALNLVEAVSVEGVGGARRVGDRGARAAFTSIGMEVPGDVRGGHPQVGGLHGPQPLSP